MPAMMACEPAHQPMLDHPGGAIRALEAMSAMAAERQRGKAATVEEEQRLLATLEVRLQLGDEARSQPAATRRRILGQVDRANFRHGRTGKSLR